LLRERWSEPAIRDQVTMAPEMMQGMAKLLELVRGLLADPAVRGWIQADPALRDLWNEPGVPQRVQPVGQP
ncbi:MAG TPA: hypothetical protein VGR27_01560, partial [Longimicrobiaceae bacterium]|nr:hypothetical protein [Longimicrobiaceae bacterium]